VNLLIVDDHPLFRQGLRLLLQTIDAALIIDETGDIDTALQKARAGDFQLILLDLRMPGTAGLATLERLRNTLPDVPVVVISGEYDSTVVRQTIDRGAMGFIPKSLTPDRLVDALRQVLGLKVYLPDDAFLATAGGGSDRLPELTARQMDVLRLVVQGKSNKRVARDMGVSAETVKSHLAAAMRALNAANRTELVYIAARRGLDLD
jgi:DNA-binding NarL/FixJ family response regulator